MSANLTPELARQWAVRVPSFVFTFGPGLLLALGVALTWDETTGLVPTVEELVSAEFFRAELLTTVFIAFVLMGWFVPRLTAWATLFLLIPGVCGPIESPVARSLWLVWAVVIVADLLLRQRQRSAATWLRFARHRATPPPLPRPGGARWLVVATFGLASLVSAFLWIDHRATLVAADERAVQAEAVVTGNHGDWVDMRVDSETFEFWVVDEDDYPVGSTQTVLVDPEGEVRPWGLDDADPAGHSLWITGISFAGVAALLIGVTPLWRRRQGVLAGEQPGVECLVRPGPHGRGLEIMPLNDADGPGPIAWIPRTALVTDTPPKTLRYWARPVVDAVRSWIANFDEHGLLGTLDASPASSVEDDTDWYGPSEFEQRDDLAPVAPSQWRGTAHGLTTDGACPMIAVPLDDGTIRWWRSVRPVREPSRAPWHRAHRHEVNRRPAPSSTGPAGFRQIGGPWHVDPELNLAVLGPRGHVRFDRTGLTIRHDGVERAIAWQQVDNVMVDVPRFRPTGRRLVNALIFMSPRTDDLQVREVVVRVRERPSGDWTTTGLGWPGDAPFAASVRHASRELLPVVASLSGGVYRPLGRPGLGPDLATAALRSAGWAHGPSVWRIRRAVRSVLRDRPSDPPA